METVTKKEKVIQNNKFLTEEELTKLQEIQTKTRNLVLELGEVDLIKIQINQRHQIAKDYLFEIQDEENKFNESLNEKYGQIQLNPETGEIIKLD
jgi:hypothetical protein|tara:strand:+ start:1600 stop:1884 length:285 start_codon:yes stop_codon:yes gene_type:complete